MDQTIKLVDLKRQYEKLKTEIDESIKICLDGTSFIGGDLVTRFEKSFAEFSKVSFCIGISNGTVALELALKSAGVKPGDEVITVSNTFFATAEAILNIGAIPVFIDVDETSGLMDLSKLHKIITKKTSAIVPVHLFGHLVDIQKLSALVENYDIKIIEDAAQAHGAWANWGGPGSLSWAAAFSFYPGKNLGAFGDAGAIVTNSNSLSQQLRKMADHGRTSKYVHELVATNARLDTIQAAVLETKLKKLREWNRKRLEIATKYRGALQGLGFSILANSNFEESAWHLFPVRVSNRNQVMDHMKIHGIETGIHYPVPLHKQPALSSMYSDVALPVTETLCSQIVSLPLHPFLEDKEFKKVVDVFLEVADPIRVAKVSYFDKE